MSEVDRLSNSGLYPVLPIGDGQRGKGESSDKTPTGRGTAPPESPDEVKPATNSPRPPKSLIDEYA